jgi:fucokinase
MGVLEGIERLLIHRNIGMEPISHLAALAGRARGLYAARLSNTAAARPWWTAVVITASSRRQADLYEWELHRREERGKIPANVTYMVVPDIGDRRIGSGAATLNAVRALTRQLLFTNAVTAPAIGLVDWWSQQRVLLIHSGGDSRRLPQYSLAGKLFSAVSATTTWGEPSTVFDEMLALSTAWLERLQCGLVIGSGDVILTFDAQALNWERPGVTGVAMLQPVLLGTRHGVYVTGEHGRIYSYLQKPSVAELSAAGGLLDGGRVALDTGLLCLDPDAIVRISELAGVKEVNGRPVLTEGILGDNAVGTEGIGVPIDLYKHVTLALTGQWNPGPGDSPALHALSAALRGLPFWCSIVSGDFTHIGTTSLFRELLTGDTGFSRLSAAQQWLGAPRQPGVRSAGVVIDSVLSGGADLGSETVAIECHLNGRVHAGAGSILHALDDIPGPVDVPENNVVHQVPVVTNNGSKGVVIRVYGVEDDPKACAVGGNATWFGRPIMEQLHTLGLECAKVWPGLRPDEWTLWNAELFPVATVEESWACARWLQGLSTDYSVERWSALERLSLATSARWADAVAIEAARSRRAKATWRMLAISLVESGADIRPLLASALGTGPLAETGDLLSARAGELEPTAPTEAASRHYVASLFFGQAGLTHEASRSRTAALRLVEQAVRTGTRPAARHVPVAWQHDGVKVDGPARIDLGGGWSDTPPFCLDWGGAVLNMAVQLNHGLPIQTSIRRIQEPIVRCIAGNDRAIAEYQTCDEAFQPLGPGDQFAIPRTALRMAGLFQKDIALADILRHCGGGIEIKTSVKLPMGSGLGTSSILAATTLRAIFEMMGIHLDNQALSEQVMHLEQLMTTGGGWQDQTGGIFPGAKLAIAGPGLHQQVRVQPVQWTAARHSEFENLMVLYYTGVPRVARDLLRQVVGRYLARETSCLQVLHSIKTLAMEMYYAMQEGEWDHLGSLIDRHWKLNQILDPHTTNAPINSLLESVRPFIRGAKLAGAGGGGFLILLAKSPEARHDLQTFLSQSTSNTGGACYDWHIVSDGLRVKFQ